ncbi:MAG: hypothetical protein AAGA10_01955 [Bacteroidota bacterium]
MSEKALVFHIGLHQTATAFFQEEIFTQLDSWNYMDRSFIQHNFEFNKLQFEDQTIYQSDAVKTLIEKIPGSRLLFSSEDLTGHPYVSAINRAVIAQRLAELSENTQIILFLRGQEDMLLSHFHNFVLGYAKSFQRVDEFVWKPQMNFTYEMYKEGIMPSTSTLYYNTAWFNVNINNFKYYELISYYKGLFGDRLHIFLYEDFYTYPETVFTRLGEILLEEIPYEIQQKAFKLIDPADLNKQTIHKKRLINRVTAGSSNKYFNKLSEKAVDLALSAVQDNSHDHNQHYIEKLVNEYYKENNRKVIAAYPEIGLDRFPNQYKV